MKAGRPQAYRGELAKRICKRLADGETLRVICADDDMPARSVVFRWIQEDIEGFADQYAKARDFQLESLADDIVGISDTPKLGIKGKTDENGMLIEATTGDMIEHRRLQVESRKWLLSKLKPNKYGDRLALTGKDGSPLGMAVEAGRALLHEFPDGD